MTCTWYKTADQLSCVIELIMIGLPNLWNFPRFRRSPDLADSPIFSDFADKNWRLCRPNSGRSEKLPTPIRKCRFCRSEIATLLSWRASFSSTRSRNIFACFKRLFCCSISSSSCFCSFRNWSEIEMTEVLSFWSCGGEIGGSFSSVVIWRSHIDSWLSSIMKLVWALIDVFEVAYF